MRVHARQWLVEEVLPDSDGGSPRVSLACADDDAQGQSLTVFWDYELDRAILQEEGWTEPERIRAFYEVRAKRVEPVGLLYLWPETN